MSQVRQTARGPLRLRKFEALLWLLPSLVLIAGVVIYPALQMVQTSFSDISISGLNRGLAGISNYRDLFGEPDLATVFAHTAQWVVLTVGITTVISLALAQLLNQHFPGRRLLRWSVIVPWAASIVMTTLSLKWILNYYYGVANVLGMWLHIISRPVDWVGSSSTSFYSLIFVGIFLSLPFTAYVLLAGLQTIPPELYEAAHIDGASAWRTYRSVVLPLLRPALVVATVLNVIYTFNSFPIVWLMTQGGPGNSTDISATLMYKLAFQNRRIGEAAALSVINIIVVMVFALTYVRVVNKRGQL
jgi:multiple sugar transport system permease protein